MTEKVLLDAFVLNERRQLPIAAERIDPTHLVDGKPPAVEAELTDIDSSPLRRGPRRYRLTGLDKPVAVRLFNGLPTDDLARLAAIAEDFLQR